MPRGFSPPGWTSTVTCCCQAPAEAHAHCDTALTADGDGPLTYDDQEIQRRATEAALLQLGHGATALRSHVRVGDVQGLDALAAVLQVRRSLRGLAELTTVAMPRVLTGAVAPTGSRCCGTP